MPPSPGKPSQPEIVQNQGPQGTSTPKGSMRSNERYKPPESAVNGKVEERSPDAQPDDKIRVTLEKGSKGISAFFHCSRDTYKVILPRTLTGVQGNIRCKVLAALTPDQRSERDERLTTAGGGGTSGRTRQASVRPHQSNDKVQNLDFLVIG